MVSSENSITVLLAANNQLEFIDHKIVKKLKKAEMIDFTANACIDDHYIKDSPATIEMLFFKIFLGCNDDEKLAVDDYLSFLDDRNDRKFS
jgi:hypothetical protein